MSRWHTHTEPRYPRDHVHVIPSEDYRLHHITKDCWCQPTKDTEEPNLFVHHTDIYKGETCAMIH